MRVAARGLTTGHQVEGAQVAVTANQGFSAMGRRWSCVAKSLVAVLFNSPDHDYLHVVCDPGRSGMGLIDVKSWAVTLLRLAVRVNRLFRGRQERRYEQTTLRLEEPKRVGH